MPDETFSFEFEDFFAPDSDLLESIVRTVPSPDDGPRASFTFDADESQRLFVCSSAPVIRLLAPAGSGKTQSIANRVARLIAEGTRPDRILLLTFDNSARNSLVERVTQAVERFAGNQRNLPFISTLNSLGNQLLKGELRDLYSGLELGDAVERHQNSILHGLLNTLRHRAPRLASFFPARLRVGVYRQFVSILKNEILTPELLKQQAGQQSLLALHERTRLLEPWIASIPSDTEGLNTRKEIVNALLSLYASYTRVMHDDRRIDYDDQKLLPHLALARDSALRSRIASRYEAVIVDEFQDINRLDFELIRQISEKSTLVVVGDDDQAIYGFRGCTPDYIIDFQQLLGREVESHILELNYRSPAQIVDMASRLIQHNERRVTKTTRAVAASSHADIVLWHSVNSATEAHIIAKTIKKLVEEGTRHRLSYSDIAVLFRINSQSLPLQMSFLFHEVPYHCRREENLLLSEHMEKILGLAELHLQLRSDRTYVSLSEARLLCRSYFRSAIESRASTLLSAATRHGGFGNGATQLASNVPQHWKREFVEAVIGLEREQSPSTLINHIGQKFKSLDVVVGDLEQALDERLPLGELLDVAQRFRGTTAEFFAQLRRLVDRAKGGLFVTGEEDAVNLLTYFRAKGRQWHTVILPGVNQRVIPHNRGRLEEERRLFYVAITRPTSRLVVSYVRNAVRQKVEPSQFLFEMGLGEGQERRATAEL